MTDKEKRVVGGIVLGVLVLMVWGFASRCSPSNLEIELMEAKLEYYKATTESCLEQNNGNLR